MHGDRPQGHALTALERQVLEVALRAGGSADPRLRAQVEAATVAQRTPSGVGFMTKLAVPESLEPAGHDRLTTLPGTHPELPAGAQFVVQVKGGRLSTIEAYCYEGMWPRDESRFRLGPAA